MWREWAAILLLTLASDHVAGGSQGNVQAATGNPCVFLIRILRVWWRAAGAKKQFERYWVGRVFGRHSSRLKFEELDVLSSSRVRGSFLVDICLREPMKPRHPKPDLDSAAAVMLLQHGRVKRMPTLVGKIELAFLRASLLGMICAPEG
ncbi:hypothetical protein IF1G_09394 [Cordyceps javanica]|uniref:Secreted protein n=1 Tax=Cordyceps javanica TaxID=43265 RepID=A0A545UQS1_9HYPO|nr:hypothetical protein IF1G_09394 [Cordyceps javanica]